ncbi:hypothetical protein LXA43DRAFT_891576 [Ganoderma leucocontextum]|nr:hypothetical protein LXA43DRAFT_891576 [Ganoderma leucocontextum]
MNEKAQPHSPAPAYPGPLPNASNPAQPHSPYTPPIQTQSNPAQQYPGQQPPPEQYYPSQHQQYPGAQPQLYPSPGVYAQGSIGPQSGFQTAPVYMMGPGVQYQQQLYAMCASGNHDVTTKYGMVGILTAVFCFPIGLLALLVDKERRCVRCGALVNI